MFGKALIVEDDRDVQRAARVALAGHFAAINLAEGAARIDQWLDAETDVVLLDMNFALGQHSGRDGLNALARIRVIDPALSVVLMTAYGSVALAVEALKQGAVDFVLKPWRNDELISTLRSAAERTRAARAGSTLDLDAIERRTIEQALQQHHGNISSAAEALGLSRPALYRRMSKHGLQS
ncbi:MAG TPA: response regulator [Steroidobacteraceae bacterium]|nr:response regulator [Steroidobacteraceae bacterium]